MPSPWHNLTVREPSPAWDDARLVQHCLDGEAAAWRALIDKYKRFIYSIPFRYGASPSDAEDIFQGVCLELYQELGNLREAGALRSWIGTVTARQSLRWKTRVRQRGETDLDDSPEPVLEDPPTIEILERGQLVHEAIARIPERCGRLIQLLFFDDPPRPYDEVAAELGLARGSIGFIRGRCLEKLRKALAEVGF